MKPTVPLEPAAKAVCLANSTPPFLFQLPPQEGRAKVEQAQSSPVFMHPAKVCQTQADTGTWGTVPLYLVAPEEGEPRQVIFYIHGAGWVFGSFHTHEKLVRELACRTNSLVVFPEYSLSPEAKYPTAINQCYHILCNLQTLLEPQYACLLAKHLTVAGDSVGGNMATVMTLMAKYRSGPAICRQLLFYPVTNAYFDTASYRQFSCGYYLYRAGMQWFWQQYLSNPAERHQITASPLCATIEQLTGLPEAMIINGEADVLRDEGEAYGRKLRQAGVKVTALRVQGTIHDFVMLNALDQTCACRAAMDSAVAWLCRTE